MIITIHQAWTSLSDEHTVKGMDMFKHPPFNLLLCILMTTYGNMHRPLTNNTIFVLLFRLLLLLWDKTHVHGHHNQHNSDVIRRVSRRSQSERCLGGILYNRGGLHLQQNFEILTTKLSILKYCRGKMGTLTRWHVGALS